jgi:hypothetical protein
VIPRNVDDYQHGRDNVMKLIERALAGEDLSRAA